nr:CoA transferase [Aliamphritea spongicola]
MKQVFATKPAYEWQQIFGDAGVPGCAHQLTREWLNSEHALACGSILEVRDPRYGNMRQLGNICWLGGDSAIVDKQPARLPGQDNGTISEVIDSWQCNPRIGVGSQSAVTGWLDGIKILDLTNVIAGPTIAGTLSRFGAEVISIDPPEPALDPWNSTVFGMQANQGNKACCWT